MTRRQDGFTLLEAIVALTIFSMGAIALYAWLGSNVKTLERVAEQREQEALVRSALDVVQRVNPMATPEGRREVGDIAVEWTAEPVEPPRQAVTQVGLPTIFKVGLFRLDVRVRRGNDIASEFSVRQLGHAQVGTLEDE